MARKRAEAEHEKQRVRQVELVQLQEESVGKQEAKKYEIQKQIEAERRATEQYRVPLSPPHPNMQHRLVGVLYLGRPQTHVVSMISTGEWCLFPTFELAWMVHQLMGRPY